MSNRPPTKHHPAAPRSEGEFEARGRIGVERGLRRLGWHAVRAGQSEVTETLLAVVSGQRAK